MREKYSSVALGAIVACMLWSTAFLGIKKGLVYTTPLNFAGLRFVISGLLILPFTGSFHHSISILKKNTFLILRISFFQTFLLYALFYTGISMTHASLAAMINGASPLFVAILAHFLVPGEKLKMKKTFIILLGLVGVLSIIASRGELAFSGAPEFWGMIILILSNLSGSYGNILVSKSAKNVSPLVLNAWQIMIGGLFLFLLSFPVEGFHFPEGPWQYWVILIWLAFLSAAAFSIWFSLLQRPGVKVSDLNTWKFLIPLLGAALGWLFMPGEYPEWLTITGMVVICIALIFQNGRRFYNPGLS